jgi:hypothetical protein
MVEVGLIRLVAQLFTALHPLVPRGKGVKPPMHEHAEAAVDEPLLALLGQGERLELRSVHFVLFGSMCSGGLANDQLGHDDDAVLPVLGGHAVEQQPDGGFTHLALLHP